MTESFKINNVEFRMDISSEMYVKQSAGNSFVLGKTPEMIENLKKRLAGQEIKNIVDIGIYKGGSCALYQEVFNPAKLVGIEFDGKRVEPLDAYIKENHLEDRMALYYGTDQADAGALKRIYRDQFGDSKLDLVVDDASHLYRQTLASFNVLFPKLRPQGLYVIEDWGWSHWPGEQWQQPKGFFENQQPLSWLIFEILMVCASSLEHAIKNVNVTGSVVYVERGYTELPEDWDVSKAYLSQGKPWGPVRS